MDAIRTLAEHVASTTFERLPAHAVAATKTFVLDTLGVAIAGSAEPWTAVLADQAARWGTGTESSVWGTARRLAAPAAAMVNAYATHALEFDCVSEAAVVHPMATLLPSLLAAAERRGDVTGRDVITAVAVGVDVAGAIGAASRAPMRFFRPATAGAFGAVAALGTMAGFDADTLVEAFGIVYGHVSGTLQPHVEGSRMLAMQMAFNARGALTAFDLAARGFTGPHDVLEGRYGYFALFEGAWDLGPALAALGADWHVARLSHKPFPSGRLTHGAIDGILRLKRAHGFAAADVAEVRLTVPPLVGRLVGRPDVPRPSASHARLCLPFVVATALLRDHVDVADFSPEALGAPDVHALAARVAVDVDGGPDENAFVPQRIEATLVSGRRHDLTLERVLGHPDAPLSREQHLDKFRRCWRSGAHPLDPAGGERLIELVDRLDEVDDVRTLLAPA